MSIEECHEDLWDHHTGCVHEEDVKLSCTVRAIKLISPDFGNFFVPMAIETI